MPKSPDVTLGRGSGWSTELWKARQHVAQRAAQKATFGLRDLGLIYELPKTGTLRRFKTRQLHEAEGHDGLSFDARRFRVHTSPKASARPLDALHAAEWAATAVHEAAHCIRIEVYSSRLVASTAAEDIISEGFARMSDYLFTRKFVPKQVSTNHFAIHLAMDFGLGEQFKSLAASASYNERVHKQLGKMTILEDVPDAALFGAQCINGHLEKGFAINDLIRQPAEELLAL